MILSQTMLWLAAHSKSTGLFAKIRSLKTKAKAKYQKFQRLKRNATAKFQSLTTKAKTKFQTQKTNVKAKFESHKTYAKAAMKKVVPRKSKIVSLMEKLRSMTPKSNKKRSKDKRLPTCGVSQNKRAKKVTEFSSKDIANATKEQLL